MHGSGARSGAAMCVGIAILTVVLSGAWPVSKARACPAEAKAKADALYKEAQELYFERLDHPENIKTAMAKAEEAVKICEDQAPLWAWVSALDFAMGESLPKESKADKDQRLDWFAKGEAAADTALKLDPKNLDALYWKTSNMASAADTKGWASSLWMFSTLMKNMQTIHDADPHYGYGAVYRFWVEVQMRVPLFLAGKFGLDLQKDLIEPLTEEIKREPRYLPNYVYLARVQWRTEDPKNREQALANLKIAITADPNALPAEKADNRVHQAMARDLWKQWTGKDYPNQ